MPLRLFILILRTNSTFFIFCVFLQRVENIPSVQSLVAASNWPNIWEEVMAFGFILISLCGIPHWVSALARVLMQVVFPAPLGPSTMIPCLTLWVSYNCIIFSTHGGWWMRADFSTCAKKYHFKKWSLTRDQHPTHLVFYGFLYFGIISLLAWHAREQVLDEGDKERFVLID